MSFHHCRSKCSVPLVHLSKSLQQELLQALEKSESRHDRTESTPKRQLVEIEEDPPASDLPRKRAKVAAQQPEVSAPLHHPRPQSFASFLKDFVDPVDTSCDSEEDSFLYEWLGSVRANPDRASFCRSDSGIASGQSSLFHPIAREQAKSVPMGDTGSDDVTSLPPSTLSLRGRGRSRGASSSFRTSSPSAGTSTSLVERNSYRYGNLARNGIRILRGDKTLPQDVDNLSQSMGQQRGSPEPSQEQIAADITLQSMRYGINEPEVEQYYCHQFFADPDPPLMRQAKQFMNSNVMPPQIDRNPQYRIAKPIPDLIYGYNDEYAFPGDECQLAGIEGEQIGTNSGLYYPFLLVEFKGDGPTSRGSMWVATNQCMGGSATCVNMVELLNNRLRECSSDDSSPVQQMNSTAFSIAVQNDIACLYVTWREEDMRFYMAQVDTFLLSKPNDFVTLRRHVRNILDWGKTQRLGDIRHALDILMEEGRKEASRQAKAPSPDKRKSPSSDKGKKCRVA